MDTSSPTCLNCEAPLYGKYCSDCGQKHVPRAHWGVRALTGELIENITNIDNKVFATVKAILRSPGKVAWQFNQGKRQKYTSPFKALIFIFLVFFLYPILTDFTLDMSTQLKFGWFTARAQTWIDHLLIAKQMDLTQLSAAFAETQPDVAAILVFLHVPFFALALWLLHPQKRHLLVDHLVAAAFFLVFLMIYLYLMIGLMHYPLKGLMWLLAPIDEQTMVYWTNLLLLKLPFPFIMFFFLRNTYQQSKLSALLKTLPACVGFLVAHSLYRTVTFYVTLWQIS